MLSLSLKWRLLTELKQLFLSINKLKVKPRDFIRTSLLLLKPRKFPLAFEMNVLIKMESQQVNLANLVHRFNLMKT
jgi:hypothetical protein